MDGTSQGLTFVDKLNSRIFSFVHLNNLVYNTCWEDPRLDREALELGPDDRVLLITSAGCNALDYALDGPRAVHAVDMNPRQNALLKLKLSGIRNLDFDDFFQIFGRGHHRQFRSVYFDALRPGLDEESRHFWDRHTGLFAGPRSFYFRGSSGRVAHACNLYIDCVARVRGEIEQLLSARTVDEQREIYHAKVRGAFWRGPIRRFVGSDLTLAMLGVPRPQRQQVEQHFGGHISAFVEHCIESVFTRLPLSDNYFWRVYLTGEYHPDCCPEYLRRPSFELLKAGLAERVHVHTNTVEGFLRGHNEPFTRFVLLDHMDWLSTFRHALLRSEWEAILQNAAPAARVLFRSGGMKVTYLDPLTVSHQGRTSRLGDLLRYRTEQAEELHQRDRVHTYGSFYIADLCHT